MCRALSPGERLQDAMRNEDGTLVVLQIKYFARSLHSSQVSHKTSPFTSSSQVYSHSTGAVLQSEGQMTHNYAWFAELEVGISEE